MPKIAETDVIAIQPALTAIEEIIPTQRGDDELEVFAARINALRLQLYVVNAMLRKMLEAAPPRAIYEEQPLQEGTDCDRHTSSCN